MDYVGIPLQDIHSSSAVLLSPTPNGQVHLVRFGPRWIPIVPSIVSEKIAIEIDYLFLF